MAEGCRPAWETVPWDGAPGGLNSRLKSPLGPPARKPAPSSEQSANNQQVVSGFAALLELDCTAQALERRAQERVKLPRRGCVAELAANNAQVFVGLAALLELYVKDHQLPWSDQSRVRLQDFIPWAAPTLGPLSLPEDNPDLAIPPHEL